MPTIKPFSAALPKSSHVNQVIAPPYDVVSREQARALINQHALNFLHVTRPEALLPEDVPFDDAQVYLAAKIHWKNCLASGLFNMDDAPHFYVYGMEDEHGLQLGLIALISTEAYQQGLVRRHELTRPDKETDRMKHIQAVEGQLSPVLLAADDDAGEFEALLIQAAQGTPLFSSSLQGIKHTLWRVADATLEQALITWANAQALFYVADGHHRTAAALRAGNPYCLAGIFPHNHMHILGYHRIIKDLNGWSVPDFLSALESHYRVAPLHEPCLPTQKGVTHMLLDGQAYSLTRLDTDETDPVKRLDVDALTRYILTPLLGIEDIRVDKRIEFIGGKDALAQAMASSQPVVFLMTPTDVSDLMAVAASNQLMPPKSTWFEPKLADGLVCYPFTPGA